jgi:hypothetical protein
LSSIEKSPGKPGLFSFLSFLAGDFPAGIFSNATGSQGVLGLFLKKQP